MSLCNLIAISNVTAFSPLELTEATIEPQVSASNLIYS